MMSDSLNIPLQQVQENLFEEKNIQLFILREDLIHPQISGNKWRKLKYNIQEAKEKGFDFFIHTNKKKLSFVENIGNKIGNYGRKLLEKIVRSGEK